MLAAATQRPAGGSVQRRLPIGVGAFDLYASLGARAETALFEGNDGLSLVMERAALRVECRRRSVHLHALSLNGESLLQLMLTSLRPYVEAAGSDEAELLFPPLRTEDSEQRLLAPSPLDAIRAALSAAAGIDGDPFAAVSLGVVAFDHAAVEEELPETQEDPTGFPDFIFWVPDSLILFEPGGAPRLLCAAFADADPVRAARNHHDAVARLARLAETFETIGPAAIAPAKPGAVADAEVDLDDVAYRDVVRRLKEEIAAGEVYQIVPSRTFRAPCPDPLRAFAALRLVEPNSYRFFLRSPCFTLFGASPETSVRVRDGGQDKEVEVRPIAGTRQRGATRDEDDRLEAEMRLDGKELAEHMMLVDLARNDVARISVPGTRSVARLLTVERYSRVMHLVSSVTGRLRPGLDALHALAACLNVGTLTGAPKLRATELLRQTERTRRGPYGGAVGWLNGAGAMDSAVVIRSALVQNGIASVRAGAGVVHDSDPQGEADETRRKAAALLSILAGSAGPEQGR